MRANHAKCAVTGLVRGQGDNSLLAASAIRQLKRRLEQVTISEQPLPFHHPHKEPYKYLGLTPTLNWRFQMRELTFGSPTQTEPTWGANQLAKLLAALPDKGQGHGIHTELPTRARTTLWELGISSLDQLLLPDGKHMVPASQLAEHLTRQGLPTPTSRVKARHKKALNSLTLLLNGAPTTAQALGKHASVLDIPLEGRLIRAAYLFCDTARHTEPIRAYPNGQLTMHAFL